MRDNVGKLTLIPHNASESHVFDAKDLLYRDGLASDELVGEVTAHQGDDQ